MSCAKHGLDTKVDGVNIFEIASELVKLSRDGLKARQKGDAQGTLKNEVNLLELLFQNIKIKKAPANRLVKPYASSWKLNLNKVYRDAGFYQTCLQFISL